MDWGGGNGAAGDILGKADEGEVPTEVSAPMEALPLKATAVEPVPRSQDAGLHKGPSPYSAPEPVPSRCP